MDPRNRQQTVRSVWALARLQHGVAARRQLLALGMSADAIRHRLGTGRLHPVLRLRGVYAVGRSQLGRRGQWMAAVLVCGPGAMLSHRSAAGLWGILPDSPGPIDVLVRGTARSQQPGIRPHRHLPTRYLADAAAGEHPRPIHPRRFARIPLTDPVTTLVDLAGCGTGLEELEDAVNAADRLRRVRTDDLRNSLGQHSHRPGVARLRALIDRDTFDPTDTRLERRFLPIAAAAGMPRPRTQIHLSGHRVDFHWPELGLVVETDGLTYHRTPSQQAKDIRRDQAHFAAGLQPLRFTRDQVFHEPTYVREMLETALRQARARPDRSP